MNPKDEITPEEKLLNLIRRPGKKSTKEKTTEKFSAHAGGQKEGRFLKQRPLAHDIDAIKSQAENIILANVKSVNFVLINKLIFLIILATLTFLSLNLYFHSPEMNNSLFSLTNKPKTKSIALREKEIKPYAYYETEIKNRDLFQAGPLEPKSKKVVPVGLTFKELIKELQLLGIMSGDSPQVIIEDRKLNKTYFLLKGDYLGEIKIEEIHSDSVMLEYKGEKITLFL